jgi:small-conductance mechanosensitive channel
MEADLQIFAVERLPVALLALVIGVAVVRIVTGFVADLGERFTERRLVFKKVATLGRFIGYLALFGFVSFTILQLTNELLLAVAGFAGVAVGFAFKDLLGSLVMGVILMVEEPFQVGDRVAFGDAYGEVVEIGLRSVRIRTRDGSVVTVPNVAFLTDRVTSSNAGNLHMMVALPFYVAATEDFTRVRRIVAEAAATSPYVFLRSPPETRVADEFAGLIYCTRITLRAYVFDARYEEDFASDVTARVKVALREAGIQLPGLPI